MSVLDHVSPLNHRHMFTVRYGLNYRLHFPFFNSVLFKVRVVKIKHLDLYNFIIEKPIRI
jgi:hypothetical protein